MGKFADRHQAPPEVLVIGQIGRDVALRAARLPSSGQSATIIERREMLGGKGANQAVGLAQLGIAVGLVGVVGEDDAGTAVLEQAQADGIATTRVIRRGQTALLVDVVDEAANRQLFEHVPDDALLTVDDIEAAAPDIARAHTVSLQLQQPHRTLLYAARQGHRAGARVVADGRFDPDIDGELFALLDVFRADAEEAELMAGEPIDTPVKAEQLAAKLLAGGPELVALEIRGTGDFLAWHGGSKLYRYSSAPVVDRTGAGDAFMAGLVAALACGRDEEQSGQMAAAATGLVVQRLGGRPALQGLLRKTNNQRRDHP